MKVWGQSRRREEPGIRVGCVAVAGDAGKSMGPGGCLMGEEEAGTLENSEPSISG